MVTATREQLGISATARLIGCSVQHVRSLANAGKLPCQVTPLGRLFDITDVAAFVATREREQRERPKVRRPQTAPYGAGGVASVSSCHGSAGATPNTRS
jgi:hypothetical protein